MGAVNVTVRVDEDTKKEFDDFCNNVGINMTTAFNMFIRATLRTRQLPFAVTDIQPNKQAKQLLKETFTASQEQSIVNETDTMTMDDVNAEIEEYRQKKSV